jgi:hypothetical protein
MRYLTTTLIFFLFLGCNARRQDGYNSRSSSIGNQKIEVTHTIEIVRLKDYVYNPGIAIRTKIKNKTGKDIFFYRPQTQTWYDYNGKNVQYTFETSMDRPLGVIPEDYQPWYDTINNPAFDLANEMIRKRPELRGRSDLQRFIFAANVFFLKNGDEKEMIDGITSIQHTLPVECKIVTSYLRPIKDGNKILDTPPTHYMGYEFWDEPIFSDTTLLNIR